LQKNIQLIGMEYMNADREAYDAHVVNTLTIQEELTKITRDNSKPAFLDITAQLECVMRRKEI
jgi:hypothetical protein